MKIYKHEKCNILLSRKKQLKQTLEKKSTHMMKSKLLLLELRPHLLEKIAHFVTFFPGKRAIN